MVWTAGAGPSHALMCLSLGYITSKKGVEVPTNANGRACRWSLGGNAIPLVKWERRCLRTGATLVRVAGDELVYWLYVCMMYEFPYVYIQTCVHIIYIRIYIYILQIDLGVSTHGEGVCKSNDVSDEWCVGWWREGYLSRDPVDWPFMSFSVRQLWYGGMRGDLVGKNSFDSYHLHILTLLPVDL